MNLEIFLKSQLAIERVRLKSIQDNLVKNNIDLERREYNICSDIINEIERQLNTLTQEHIKKHETLSHLPCMITGCNNMAVCEGYCAAHCNCKA